MVITWIKKLYVFYDKKFSSFSKDPSIELSLTKITSLGKEVWLKILLAALIMVPSLLWKGQITEIEFLLFKVLNLPLKEKYII